MFLYFCKKKMYAIFHGIFICFQISTWDGSDNLEEQRDSQLWYVCRENSDLHWPSGECALWFKPYCQNVTNVWQRIRDRKKTDQIVNAIITRKRNEIVFMNTLPPNFNKWLAKDWRSQKTDNVFSAILTKMRNERLFMEKHHTWIMYLIVTDH